MKREDRKSGARTAAPRKTSTQATAPRKKRIRATETAARPRKPAAAPKPEPRRSDTPRAERAPRGSGDVLGRLRSLCLALPETGEKEAWGTPTFRVRDKMFAMFADDHHGDGRVAVWCKAPVGAQEALIESDPEVFFKPPYVGPSGWIGVRLDQGLDWEEIGEILREGWRVAAPKKLAATLPRE